MFRAGKDRCRGLLSSAEDERAARRSEKTLLSPFIGRPASDGRQWNAMKRRIQCSLCGDAGYIIDKNNEFCVARLCACQKRCAVCGGSGYIYEKQGGYEVVRECSCTARSRRIRLFNAARIPARCDGTFDNFTPRSKEMELAKMTAAATAQGYQKEHPSRGFIISGPVGTGKTHLLCAALRWLTLEAGVTARYVEISFLYSEIKDGFSHGQSVLEALQPLIEPDVLAIDEIGRGNCKGFELETFDELIARRYNTRKTTILATNFRLGDKRPAGSNYHDPIEAQASPYLVDRIGPRSWSRISEMCHCLEIPPETEDYRRL
jgi:DNA replication protein